MVTIVGSRSLHVARVVCLYAYTFHVSSRFFNPCILLLLLIELHLHVLAFIIQAYGVVLAPIDYPSSTPPTAQTDTPQGNLSRTLGSIVGTACLRAETRVGPQLTSHVFGLLKARYEEGLSSEDRWLSSDEGTEWVVRSVDRIRDVARGEEFGERNVEEWEGEAGVKAKL